MQNNMTTRYLLSYLEKNDLPEGLNDFDSNVEIEKRLYNIWQDFNRKEENIGLVDWLSWIRQYSTWCYFNVGHEIRFWVKKKADWPNAELWQKYGFKILSEDENSYYLEFIDWKPEWLINQNVSNPVLKRVTLGKDSISGEKDLIIDPPIKEVFKDYNHFSSYGQMWALRTFVLSPKGSNLLAILPTGSGKTLVAIANAFLGTNLDNLTLMIVPTTALAIDMERRLQQLVNNQDANYAYYADLDDFAKAEIKANITNRKQKFVVCSPETAMGALEQYLSEAAKNGCLKNIVIDEAHILNAWGNDFRPDFYGIMTFRKKLKLLSSNKLKTLFISGTVTKSTLNVIKFLLNDTLMVISAVYLRYEPEYWFHFVKNSNFKYKYILECVRFCPKPMIIYTSKKNDAASLCDQLKQEGYRRIKLFTGDTDNFERRVVIDDWQKNNIDIIVATSAFGMGVDKSDVRTVIHACVPETLDRFYQEVGRSGRDGKPSISITIFNNDDINFAKQLGIPRYIGSVKALHRWEAMRLSRIENTDTSLFTVNLESCPLNVDKNTDFNRNWNFTVLNNMARLGWIDFDYKNNNEFEVKMLDAPVGVNGNINAWNSFEEYSAKEKEYAKREFSLFEDILFGRKEIAEQLGKIYDIGDTSPLINCGGCPICRANKGYIKRGYGVKPIINQQWIVETDNIKTRFTNMQLDYGKAICVFYEKLNEPKFFNAIKSLVITGFVEICCSNSSVVELLKKNINFDRQYYVFYTILNNREPYTCLEIPRIVVLGSEIDTLPDYLIDNYSYPLTIFVQNNIRDCYREDRLLRNVYDNGKTLNEFIRSMV